MKVNGGYDWLKYSAKENDGCMVSYYHASKLYNIINSNRFNQIPPVYYCPTCKCYNRLNGSYIAIVEEDEFLANPSYYIDNAYDKSENDASGYKLTKTI